MDRAWWNEYGAAIKQGPELWTTNREAARIYGLNLVKGEPGGGVSTAPNTIRLGGNSGFQAVGLAILFGAARVILLGFDMQMTGGKTHWHGDHRRLGNPVQTRMREWHRRFGEMAGLVRIPVLNASRATALKCFPIVDLNACLAEPAALGS